MVPHYLPSTTPSSCFWMEVLVEQHQDAPVWIIGVSLIISVAWPSSILIGQKQRHHAPAQFESNITQAHAISRPGGALDH